MATTEDQRMETHLWCYECDRLHSQPRGDRGFAPCLHPVTAFETVVDVLDARSFLGCCHPDPVLRRGSHAAAEPEILLPTVTVHDAGRDCAVCMEELEPGASAHVTPCGHAYHPGCVAPWIEAKRTCPLCRRRVVVAGGADRDKDGLVLCRFSGGRLGLGRRVAGRVFSVKVLDADGNIERPRMPREFKRMLRAMFRRNAFVS